MNKLDQLKKYSVVVADTGDIDEIRKFKPQDATTNPSIMLKAINQTIYSDIVSKIVRDLKTTSFNPKESKVLAVDKFGVHLAKEILEIIDGYVSIEVDSRLSFDTDKTIERAKGLISECKNIGIDYKRVLIKIAGTWEGILAAEKLKKSGIKSNITLVFNIAQAAAAAEAGLFLISPFVGRISDWYKKNDPQVYEKYDPGVKSVVDIYSYLKSFEFKTIVMAASFRNIDQIEKLSGCDRLTIAPTYLKKLAEDEQKLDLNLSTKITTEIRDKIEISESNFRWLINQSAMSNEKLAEGIKAFASDQELIEKIFEEYLK